MKLKQIILLGAGGRMANLIAELAQKNGVEILPIEKNGSFPENVKSKPGSVLVDFSTPEGFERGLAWCLEANIPFVSGTTGLSDLQFSNLKKASAHIPVLWAANMSLGVHVVAELLKNLSGLPERFNFHIEEAHHKDKKDAPSGTAIFLKSELLKSVGSKDVPISSLREGAVIGSHKIVAISADETISIEHTALDRKLFAQGAIVAAKWICEKDSGSYDMKDVLGFC